MTHATTVTDTSDLVRLPTTPTRISTPVGTLEGSAILKIAAEIRKRVAAGEQVCNLTVGDFDPRQFPIPKALEDGIVDALRHHETNYPPSAGMPPLREAIVAYTERSLGLRYPVESVLVTSGSRPGVYGAYATLVDPGDKVVFGVPSWNNNYYCHMVGAEAVPVACLPEDGFQPTAAALAPHLRAARLLALNSPLNPCGTCFDAATLGAICDLVLEENASRPAGERPLYLVYDQVYWQLTFGDIAHVDPVSLRPEMARYTVYVDGISKAFASTGVRVGWVLGPTDVVDKMNNFLQHVGTWAPRAEQLATAHFLLDEDAIRPTAPSIFAVCRPGSKPSPASKRCAPLVTRSTRWSPGRYLERSVRSHGTDDAGRSDPAHERNVRQLPLRPGWRLPFDAFGAVGENWLVPPQRRCDQPGGYRRCTPRLRAGLELLSNNVPHRLHDAPNADPPHRHRLGGLARRHRPAADVRSRPQCPLRVDASPARV
jgi:aspartate aminotransferase